METRARPPLPIVMSFHSGLISDEDSDMLVEEKPIKIIDFYY